MKFTKNWIMGSSTWEHIPAAMLSAPMFYLIELTRSQTMSPTF